MLAVARVVLGGRQRRGVEARAPTTGRALHGHGLPVFAGACQSVYMRRIRSRIQLLPLLGRLGYPTRISGPPHTRVTLELGRPEAHA